MEKELYLDFQVELRKPFLESKLVLKMINQLLEEESNIPALILEKNKLSIRLFRGTRNFASISCTAALRGVADCDRKNISFFNICASRNAPVEVIYIDNCRAKTDERQEFGPIWSFKVYKHPNDQIQQTIERTIASANNQSIL